MPFSLFAVRWRHTVLVALLAALFQLEVDPTRWRHEEAGVFKRSSDDVFNYVIRPEEVRKFAPVFGQVSEVDSAPFGVGKKFKTVSNVFLDFESEFRITKLSGRERRLVVESADHLRPVISVEVEPHVRGSGSGGGGGGGGGGGDRCALKISVYYNRRSALFQYTLAPLLKYLTQQHVRHALFSLNWAIPPPPSKDT